MLKPRNHRTPEAYVVENLLPSNPLRALKHNDRKLAHLSEKTVAPKFLRDASHHDFVTDGRYKESDEGGHRTADVWA